MCGEGLDCVGFGKRDPLQSCYRHGPRTKTALEFGICYPTTLEFGICHLEFDIRYVPFLIPTLPGLGPGAGLFEGAEVKSYLTACKP